MESHMVRYSNDRRFGFSRTRLEVERLEDRDVPTAGMTLDCQQPMRFAAAEYGGVDASVIDYVFAHFSTDEVVGRAF